MPHCSSITIKNWLGLATVLVFLQTVSLEPAQAACTPPPANLVSWWGGDNNVLDMVGTNHGSLVNGATYAAGQVRQAFSFDGVNDYVEVTGATGDFGSNAFTVDFWMNSNDNGANSYLVGKSHPDGGQGWDIRLNNNTIRVVGVNGWAFNITSDTSATANTWHHIAVAAGASQVNLYIDGVLKGSSGRSVVSSTINPFRIGHTSNYGGPAFNGLIDEVEIFDRALDQAEIQAIYNAGSDGKCRSCTPPPSDMVSWWRSENNPDDSVGTNHGTLINGATYTTGLVGQAFSLDGINDFVRVADAPNLNFGPTSPLTIFLWEYTPAVGTAHLIAKRTTCADAGTSSQYQLAQDFSNGHQSNSGGLNLTTGQAPLINQWQLVALTFDGSTYRIYVDSQEKASIGGTVGATNNGAPVLIGATGEGCGVYSGLLDEIAIVNRALSANEIGAIYNAGSAGMCFAVENSPPVAVDDSASTQTNTLVTTVNVLNNDTDVDGDTLSVSAADTTGAQGGTVSNNGDGTFDYTPPFNYVGSDSFDYTVSDGNGGTDVGTVDITVNPKSWSSFHLIKDFDDDNPMAVEVSISCNSGLPLTQRTRIRDDADPAGGVSFIVKNFSSGEMDCTLTETPVPGYAAEYENITEPEVSDTSCFYSAVIGGAEHSCVITNRVQPVPVAVRKEWITIGSGSDLVDQTAFIDAFSPTFIKGGDACYNTELGQNGYCARLTFNGPQTGTQSLMVLPHWQGVTVLIEETVFDDAIETVNGCGGSVQILPGQGASCAISNTVFFEGIPSLSRPGLALLALLMLGIGAVGLRRFI